MRLFVETISVYPQCDYILVCMYVCIWRMCVPTNVLMSLSCKRGTPRTGIRNKKILVIGMKKLRKYVE